MSTDNQDMKWRAEESARIEQQLIDKAKPAHCGGDCGDCNGCQKQPPFSQDAAR